MRILSVALREKDGELVELGLSLGFRIGIAPEILSPLLGLAQADWHERHEDVADALGRIGDPAAVGALRALALARFSYRDYDESDLEFEQNTVCFRD